MILSGNQGAYFVCNAGDEGLDIQLCGTALLTGSVGTLQAPGGLAKCCPFTESCMFNVIKVLLFSGAILLKGWK